jgi:curved DNA-binding protein
MGKQRDYYEVLGVERGANKEQIRKAYRKLARQLHPDVNKAPDAARKFSEVQEAYDALSDDEKRKLYDQFGHVPGSGAGPSAPGGGRAQPGGRSRTVWTNVPGAEGFGSEDLSGIFEQMFGRAGTRAGSRGRSPFGGGFNEEAFRPQPQQGADVEHAITVTFLTAALGGTEHVRMTSGETGEAETISVKIPPGVESGAKLRVRGKGHAGRAGGAAGDMILTVQVGDHPYFRREGLNILVDVPITIAEAVLGAKVTVPLLPVDGKSSTAEIKVPPHTSSGRRLRVKSKGITDAKGRSGDFYAVVQIVAPHESELASDDIEAVRRLTSRLQNPRESAPWAGDGNR